MTGTSELRLGSAIPDSAGSGRPAASRLARSGERSEKPFAALLAEAGPRPGADPAGTGDARPLDRFVRAEIGDPRHGFAAASPLEAREAGAREPSPAAEVVPLDPVPHGQTLAHHVAERIAASLGGAEAGAASTDVRSETGPSGRGGTLPANLALAASLARRADAAGPASSGGSPAFSVTHRETHFAAQVLPAAGTPFAGRGSQVDGSRAAALTGTTGPELAPEPGAIRQGRAEQLAIGGRAAPAPAAAAPAKAAETAANGLVRAAAEDAKPGGGKQPAGGEPSVGTAYGAAALGLTSAADPRVSAAGSPAGAPPAQPGAMPSAFPATPGAVKVLHIQLHPAELGMLEVRMRLTDSGLEVHIEASRRETAALLKSDRDAIASVLGGAGQAVDAVTVSLADKSNSAGQPSQDGWQPSASGARPEAQAGSPREQGGRFDDRSPSRPGGGRANDQVIDDQNHSAAVRPRGGLYL